MIGRVHSFQSLGAVDGPGIRCVVFMQGCPLRCGYCHNPDTWDFAGGTATTATDMFKKVKRIKPYFGAEGGVTVSGGEPLMQAEFVTELFEMCHAEGIHTTLDTSGMMLDERVMSLLDVTDLVLLDIKMTTEEDYAQHVGCKLDAVMEFLQELQKRNKPTWIRHVVVQDFNDSTDDIHRLRELMKPYSCIEKVELLPFRKLCIEKYKELGKDFRFDIYPQTDKAAMDRVQAALDEK